MFVNEIITPTEEKKKKLSFELFLKKMNDIENVSIGKVTKSGNTKILKGKKIIFYSHKGKKYPIIFWDNLQKKQRHIKSMKELNKIVAEIQ